MKRWSIIIVVTVGVLVLGMFGVELWLRVVVGRTIEEALAGDKVRVSLGRVSVSLPTRRVTVRDVRIKAQNNDVGRRGYTVVSLDVAFSSLSLRGVDVRRHSDGWDVRADRLALEGLRGTLVTDNEGRDARIELGGGRVSARDVSLDSLPSDIRLEADSALYAFDSGEQLLRIDSLALDTASGTIALAGAKLEPQIREHARTHADATIISTRRVVCEGVDFQRMVAAGGIAMASVAVEALDITSSKDRNVFEYPRVKVMLYQNVQGFPLPLDIETVRVDDLDIRYSELAQGADEPGVVTLTDGRIVAENITNTADGHDRFMKIDLVATLMQSGLLEARFGFPVSAADDHWEIEGRLGPTDMTAFNGALTPLLDVRIVRGRIGGMEFDIAGTLRESRSGVTMTYNDLDVVFLKKHDHASERKLLTVLVDDLLISPDNPPPGGEPVRTPGTHTRDPERSMWNYIWRSLLGAILKSVT